MRMAGSLLCGLVFGLGLWISGMAQPVKVIGFLDIFGRWDPSLGVVMVSAVSVAWIGYRLVWRRDRPLLAPEFDLPSNRRIDARLLAGAALFGAGWGLGGDCPGPALTNLGFARPATIAFVACMCIGIALVRNAGRLLPRYRQATT